MAVVLAGPAVASAAPRYASPNGGTATGCPKATPCDLRTAIEMAQPQDEVIVLHGDYGSPSAPLPGGGIATLMFPIAVHGEDGAPRPRIFLDPGANDPALRIINSTARYLEVQAR